MKKVESSCMKGYEYNKEKQELFIQFNTDVVYGYINVPEDIYEQLEQSESKGKFFCSKIKPCYACERV